MCPPLGESFIGGSTRVHLDVVLKICFLSLLKINYEEQFVKRVLNLRTVTLSDVLHRIGKADEEVQIKYSSIKEFKTLAKHLKIMDDLRVLYIHEIHNTVKSRFEGTVHT